jgi:hypothetical protein
VLTVPVLLVLNEVFGKPPLFTPGLPEPVPLAGVWSGTGVTLSIAPDGSVFGTFGTDQVYRASVRRNRTWVGRTLKLRTDYIIDGRLGQHRFTAPIDIHEGQMRASFFIFEGQLKPGPAHVLLDRKT